MQPMLVSIPLTLGVFLYPFLVWLLGALCLLDFWGFVIPYSQELRGIAARTRIPLGKLVLLQYLYEAGMSQ